MEFPSAANDASKKPNAFAFEACDVGGRIWFGGYNPNYAAVEPTWLDLRNPPLDSTYQVFVSSLGVNDKMDVIVPGYAIYDTGSTSLNLPQAQFDTVTAELKKDAGFSSLFASVPLDGKQYDCVTLPVTMTRADLEDFLPPMRLQFQNDDSAKLTWKYPATRSYLGLIPLDQDHPKDIKRVCYNIGVGDTIIGNSFMREMVSVFDLDNKRLGLATGLYCDDPISAFDVV